MYLALKSFEEHKFKCRTYFEVWHKVIAHNKLISIRDKTKMITLKDVTCSPTYNDALAIIYLTSVQNIIRFIIHNCYFCMKHCISYPHLAP